MSDATNKTNLLGLPAELIVAITGDWLLLKDLVRLDSAVCESEARSVLHASFRSLDASVIGPDCKSLDLGWMLMRRIHMEAVFYPHHSSTDKLMKTFLVNMFGHRIKFLTFAPSSCTRIAVIYRPDVSSLVMTDRLRTDEDNKKTRSLFSSSDETKRSPMHTTTSSVGLLPSSRLQLLAVDITVDRVTEAWLYSLIAPEFVQRLRPTFLHIYDWQRFTSLRSLGFNGTRQVDIDKLTMICIQCSEIVHLDLSKVADLSDAMVSVVVRHLRCVRSLNLEGGRDITDGSLMDLVSSYQHSLVALCIYNCYFVTATAINHIITHCTKLRTFSFLPKEGVDYSLLSNITTLITSFPRDTAKWTLLQQYCIRVEQLYFVVAYDRYNRPLTALHCKEDVLHKLHTLHHVIEPLSLGKPAEVLAAVRYVRPSVQVRAVEFQTWYNFDLD